MFEFIFKYIYIYIYICYIYLNIYTYIFIEFQNFFHFQKANLNFENFDQKLKIYLIAMSKIGINFSYFKNYFLLL